MPHPSIFPGEDHIQRASFMTHAMKAIYKLLLSDYVKVSKVSVEDMLYDEQDILCSMDKIEVLDFHQTLEVNGIQFWCYTAGHVLGAAMFMVDIAGVRVLYTGDYSHEEDRHLHAAEIPQFCPDICIIEATYGVQLHQPQHVVPKNSSLSLMSIGLTILSSITSPYFMLPLQKVHGCLPDINSMNERIRDQFGNSTFGFKHISPLKSIENFNDVGPSVVMASLVGFRVGCQDNCLICGALIRKMHVFTWVCCGRDIGKTIINEPKEVTLMNGLTAPLNMLVHFISFFAHADFAQTSTFLKELMPPNIILVHGEANEMGRLKQKLITQFADCNTKIISPKNCQSVEMYFNSEKMAKTIGRLAEKTPEVGETVSGLLRCEVGRNGNLVISVDGNVVHLDKQSGNVEGENEGLKERVRVAFQRIQNAVKPILHLCLSSFPQVFSVFSTSS
ncbi:hypothetical protein AAG906_037943 [Vitis piasezkii]